MSTQCDSCHVRKVRCDRNDPCGNCLDQSSPCTRSRGMKRLPKRDLTRSRARSRSRESSLPLGPTISATASATGATAAPSTSASTSIYNGLRSQQSAESNHSFNFNVHAHSASAFDNSFLTDILEDPIMLLDVGCGYGYAYGYGYGLQLHSWMSIVPLTDAQMINRRRRVESSNAQQPAWGRNQVLESALSVAGQVLGSIECFTGTSGTGSAEDGQQQQQQQRNVPSLEFLYWMLKDIGSDKFGSFISDYFRHISNQTLKHMGLALLFNTARHPDSILYTVCVNSVVYKFLNATIATESDPELAKALRASALLYCETAKAALQRIPLTAKPSLVLLQALLCGIFLSQGTGDTNSCRELAKTACRVCMDIGIGIGTGMGATGGTEGKLDLSGVSEEEYYCFMWCYTLDRNYAWKIGSPLVLLVDPETDVDPPVTASASQLIRIYLDLAKVQDAMIPFLNDPDKAASDESFQAGKYLLGRMEGVRRDIDLIKPPSTNWRGLDSTSEIATLDFAYHSILTNLLHLRQISFGHTTPIPTAAAAGSTTSTTTTPAPQTEADIYLDSARRNLLALITICASTDQQKTVAYLHWTILYYPITACFAVFCNAIVTGHAGDFEILSAVSNSLAKSGSLSAPIAAMRRLLQEFVALSRGVFGTTMSETVEPAQQDYEGNIGGDTSNAVATTALGSGALTVPVSVQPLSPWVGGVGQDGLGMELGVVPRMAQQMDGTSTAVTPAAGVEFMVHDDLVFSF
ncbi:hypothetical protein BJX64DRAFT_9 [Aspergillus heterothallicus]